MPTNAPGVAQPSKEIFDPFNSSSTGHQRAENRLSGSTLWRDSRHRKLREQFGSGAGGGKRVSDTVGGGAVGELKMGLKENGTITWRRENDQASLYETLKVSKDVERPAKRVKLDESKAEPVGVGQHPTPIKVIDNKGAKAKTPKPVSSPSQFLSPIDPNSSFPDSSTSTQSADEVADEDGTNEPAPEQSHPQIFADLTMYINGSTGPDISDHRLKHILTTHGANMSVSLGRRTVTHVIIGRPNSNGGSGGGLAGSKIQKEIASKQSECVKYVTAEWVMESVKAGKRLPERNFAAVKLAPKGVASVADMFNAARGKGPGRKVAKQGQG